MLSKIKSISSGVRRILIASVPWGNVGRFLTVFVPSLLLYHFFSEMRDALLGVSVSTPAVSEPEPVPSILTEWVKRRLPVSPTFYFLVIAFAGISIGWRWCSYAKLSREIEGPVTTKGTSSLTDHDWGVIRGLRNRAFHLRTRSGIMLAALIFLLFGAIDFVFSILPEVRGRDRVLIEKAALREREAILRERYEHTLRLMSRGGYWLEMDAKGLELAEGETIRTASFAPDGRRGIAGGTASSAFLTKDGGRTWSRPAGLTLKRPEQEYVAMVNFGVNDDSESMLVVGDEGSVFVTRDEGETWTPLDGLELAEGEMITTVSFASDGRRGIAGSTASSVFFTKDGGRTWSRLTNLTLKESGREYVAMVEFGVNDDSETMLVVGDEGSVFVTRDEGETWTLPGGLELTEDETIRTVSFAPDGRRGIAGGTASSAFLTKDGGRTWSRPAGLTLKRPEQEYVAMVNFGVNDDSESMLVVGDEGSVFVTRDEGETWTPLDGLELAERETIRTVSFAPDGRRGIAGSTASSVFFTKDGGRTWSRLTNLTLKRSEREYVAMVEFGVNDDSKTMLVVGDEGSVFVTRDKGETWLLTEGLDSVTKELVAVQAMHEIPTKERPVDQQNGDGRPSEEKDGSQYSFLMMADDGAYVLKPHPIRPEQSLSLIQSSVEKDDVLRRSVFGKNILADLQELPDLGSNREEGGEKERFIDALAFYDLTLMRIASMTILFFLVQLLVRLYQYNLRLASFLDSRADAVLLARTFTSGKSIPFDDLVRSMAPDDYDFKPQPRPMHEAGLNRLPLQRNP